jgi:hypothetical protein
LSLSGFTGTNGVTLSEWAENSGYGDRQVKCVRNWSARAKFKNWQYYTVGYDPDPDKGTWSTIATAVGHATDCSAYTYTANQHYQPWDVNPGKPSVNYTNESGQERNHFVISRNSPGN